MKHWTYGANNYYKTAAIYVEEAPWYIFFIEFLINWICDHFPAIPLPNIGKVKIKDEDIKYITYKEAYDDLAGLFHDKIHSPIFDWVYSKIKVTDIEVSYDKLKEEFYDKDKKYWDSLDEDIVEETQSGTIN